MSKKSEASQMFQMLTTLIVIGAILILGFQLIGNLFSRSEEIDYINFRRSLIRQVDAVASDYNARQRIELTVPRGSLALCFVDLAYQGNIQEYPLINSYWRDDDYRTQSHGLARNTFLVGSDFFISVAINNLDIDSNERYLCIETARNRVEFWAEGRGRRVSIEPVRN